MNGRWLVNILMLILLLAGVIYAFTFVNKEPEKKIGHAISDLKLSDFNEITINFPDRAKTSFKLSANGWLMTAPYEARADELYVYRILSLIATTSSEKLSADDLAKYGLDQPKLKITFTGVKHKEEFLFGTYNPITENQYLFYGGNVFIVNGGFSETSSFEPLELINKTPIASDEKIIGYDFSRLEQWQGAGLKLSLEGGKWKALGLDILVSGADMDEWFNLTWNAIAAKSVEFYKLDPRAGHKSFDVVLHGNKKITFYRIQESPELLLLRKDENLLYHFPGDLGFTMLNPNVIAKEEK